MLARCSVHAPQERTRECVAAAIHGLGWQGEMRGWVRTRQVSKWSSLTELVVPH
jgi:hypothetical protein